MVADITLTDSLPVYVQANKAKVAKDGDNLEISVNDQVASRPRIAEISHLALFGNVYLTTPTLHELMRREVAVSWHRSEERRVGKEGVSTCRFRGWTYH